MKKRIAYILLIVFLIVPGKDLLAADSVSVSKVVERHTIFKFFPFALAAGQLGQYCSELRFAVEQKIAKQQSLQIGLAFDYPSVFSLIGQNFENDNDFGEGTKVFVGGRLLLSYRYYFAKKTPSMLGFYGAVEGSFNYMASNSTWDSYYDQNLPNEKWATPNYTAHIIMSNYGLTLGYQMEKVNKHTGRHVLIDAGLNGNYRYYYFWRHYAEGNLEYAREGIYAFYKQFPLGGAINFSIGWFLKRNNHIAVSSF